MDTLVIDEFHTLKRYLRTGDPILFSGRGAISTCIELWSESEWSHIGVVFLPTEADILWIYSQPNPPTLRMQANRPYLFESNLSEEELPNILTGVPKSGCRLVDLEDKIENYHGNEFAVRFVTCPRVFGTESDQPLLPDDDTPLDLAEKPQSLDQQWKFSLLRHRLEYLSSSSPTSQGLADLSRVNQHLWPLIARYSREVKYDLNPVHFLNAIELDELGQRVIPLPDRENDKSRYCSALVIHTFRYLGLADDAQSGGVPDYHFLPTHFSTELVGFHGGGAGGSSTEDFLGLHDDVHLTSEWFFVSDWKKKF